MALPKGYLSGVGNIAHRFEITVPYRIVSVRAHFNRLSGGGTSIADLTMTLDARLSREENHTRYNQVLWTWLDAGVGQDVAWLLFEDERPWFEFGPGDHLFFQWTNPDALNEIDWGLQINIEEP